MDAALAAEARRLLDRYLIEVVEAYELCPWAASARRRGEIRVEVVAIGDAAAAVDRIAGDRAAAIGMVVLAAAADAIAPPSLRRLRDELLAGRSDVAIADFHPAATADLSSPARLVPFLRRAPDPMLQVVRREVLEAVKRAPPPPGLASQAAMLAGRAAAPEPDIAERIARANLATVARAGAAAVGAVLDDIERDRDASYARLRAAAADARL